MPTPSACESLCARQALPATIIDHSVCLVIIDSIAALLRAQGELSLAQRQALLGARNACRAGSASARRLTGNRCAGQQASVLKRVADDFGIPVVVSNQVQRRCVCAAATWKGPPERECEQVTANFAPETSGRDGDESVVAAMGTAWAHAANLRLVLETVQDVRYIRVRISRLGQLTPSAQPGHQSKHCLQIAKSPAAQQTSVAFQITGKGLQERRTEVPAAPPRAGTHSIANELEINPA